MQTNKDTKDYCEEGKKLREAGNLAQAIEKYSEALQINSECISALSQLAEIYEGQENFEKAINFYEQILQLQPDNGETREKLARAYIGLATTLREQADLELKILFDRLVSLHQKANSLKPDSHKFFRIPSFDGFQTQKDIFKDTKEPLLIFDVGAKIGDVTERYCRLFPNSQIHCFDPAPNAFNLLEQRFASTKNVAIHELALSDRVKKAKFYLYEKASGLNSLLPLVTNQFGELENASIEVPVTTLDRFCEEQGIEHIDILKFDIQGAELQALNGAKSLLKKEAIGLIYTEVHFGNFFYEGQGRFEDLASFLYEFGFVTYDIYNLHYHYAYEGLRWADVIFLSSSLMKSLEKSTRSQKGDL